MLYAHGSEGAISSNQNPFYSWFAGAVYEVLQAEINKPYPGYRYRYALALKK